MPKCGWFLYDFLFNPAKRTSKHDYVWGCRAVKLPTLNLIAIYAIGYVITSISRRWLRQIARRTILIK